MLAIETRSTIVQKKNITLYIINYAERGNIFITLCEINYYNFRVNIFLGILYSFIILMASFIRRYIYIG